MSDRWIRCVECEAVWRVTDYDRLPTYYYDQEREEVVEKPMDDEGGFMGKHKAHTLEELFMVRDSFISNGRYGEPLKTSYYEATNGTERFVIKGWRDDVSHPMSYELIPGYIETTFTFQVQSRELRKQLAEETRYHALSEVTIERFIQTVEKVIAAFPAKDPLEITAETDTPLISHCKMWTSAVREILRLGKKIFDESELNALERFIYSNNDCNGPMTLLLRRRFAVKRERTLPARGEEKGASFNRGVVHGK